MSYPSSFRPAKPEPRRAGAVVVFREGVTQEQARKALASLGDVLDYQPSVELFDPRFGGPVFYVP